MARIEFDDFLKVEICTGTITDAKLNPKARGSAYVLTIDFGEKETRVSSAQLTDNYTEEALVGKQVVAVMNFNPKRVAGIKSEVLILGAVCPENGVALLEPTFRVSNGARIA
jgi:tRNA-binding protein